MRIFETKNKNGFTLIELLVVMAIIGLLASVVLVSLNSSRAKSRDAKRLADMKQMATAMELYFNTNNNYPTQAAAAVITGTTVPNGLAPTFVGKVPTSPLPADGTCTLSGTSTGGVTVGATGNNSYIYTSANGSTYTINFCLGATTGNFVAGNHIVSPAGIQ
jgi:prepilin-type N-terminal cleavage/methylation domain-containing protein